MASMMRGAGPAFPTAEHSPGFLPWGGSFSSAGYRERCIVNARDAMTAEPLDSPDQAADASRQPEIMNARDTMTVEPLDLPDVREQRGRGSRIPSSDGAIVSGS